MERKEKGCLLFFLLFITIVVVLLLAVKLYINYRVFSTLSPGQRKEYEIWLNEKISFHPEDIVVEPFGQSTILAASEFYKQWDTHAKAAVQFTQEYKKFKNMEPHDLTVSDINLLKSNLETFKPLLDAFRSIVEQPDYEIEAFPESATAQISQGIPVPDFLSLQCMAKICALQSLILSLEGRHKEAFQYAGIIIKSSRSHKYPLLITHLIRIALYSIGADVWKSAVERCNDYDLLRETLTTQNQLRHRDELMTSDVPVMILDNIGTIMIAQRKGIKSDIQGMTGQEITAESFRVQAVYLENLVLPKVNDAEQRSLIQKSIKGFRSLEAGVGGGSRNPQTLVARLVGSFARPLFYSITVPNFNEASIRAKVSCTKFDLLRIYTASKLYLLEHEDYPGLLNDLVPKYLPDLPEDPFGQKYKGINHLFYSVGADGVDQNTAILYDPTNGTISSGDIFFP